MWGLVGKNLVKREGLLIGGVRMWGFEPFDDERAIKTKRAPVRVCTYSYVLTSTKKNQGKRNTKTTLHPLPVLLLLETDRDIREKKRRKKIGGTL